MTIPVSAVTTPGLSEWAVPKAAGGDWSVGGIGNAPPVGDRDLLHPLHPHRIVDVAELVDVLGKGGEGQLEDGARHVFPVSVRMKA